jgi:hypothetical protein
MGAERKPRIIEVVLTIGFSADKRFLQSWSLMPHLRKVGKLREVIGDDAAERTDDLFSFLGGQGQPPLTRLHRVS